MPEITLPKSIERYLSAKTESLWNEAASCFDPDATIYDNGEDHVISGIKNITDWLSNTSAKYKMTSEVTEAKETDGITVAKVIVTGDFPASPYEFSYRFTVVDDKIQKLSIDPIGSLAP